MHTMHMRIIIATHSNCTDRADSVLMPVAQVREIAEFSLPIDVPDESADSGLRVLSGPIGEDSR